MDADAVRLVNHNRLPVHQEIFILIIHLKGCNLIGIVIEAYEMLPVGENGDSLRIVAADGRGAHFLQHARLLVNRIDDYGVHPCVGAEQELAVLADLNVGGAAVPSLFFSFSCSLSLL